MSIRSKKDLELQLSTLQSFQNPSFELLGWSSDLRSATEGRGNSSLVDQMFGKMPFELQEKVRQQIIQRKGLSAGELGA